MSRVPRSYIAPFPRPKRPRTGSLRRLTTGSLALALIALLGLTTLSVSAVRPFQSTDTEAPAQQKTSQSSGDSASFVPGDILVRYRSEAKAQLEEMAATPVQKGGRMMPLDVQRFAGSRLVTGLRLARVQPEDTLDAIAALRNDPDVLYAEPNYILRKELLPNDPRFGEMYGLRNTGQTFNGQAGGTPGADINAEQAWNITTGSSNVVVGIIDTGVDINHPDLQPNIWTNPGESGGGKETNGIDDDGNGRIDDVHGWDFYCASGTCPGNNTVYDSPTIDDHGTHVAGTIGAAGNNGIGVTGINWQVKLMPLKFLGSASGSGPTSSAIAAIEYAVFMRLNRGVNIRVLNNSWGSAGTPQALVNAVSAANNAGILFVAAAGNGGVSTDDFPHSPSNIDLPNVISVGRTNHFDNVSASSNFGARTVELGAPGFSILSTTPNNTYSFFSGTSMSAPHVTGVAALILALNPDIPLPRLRAALVYSGNAASGVVDKFNGACRLNAYQALLNSQESDLTPPVISGLNVVAQNGRSITLGFSTGDDGTGGSPASLYSLTFSSANGAQYYMASLVPTASGLQTIAVNVPYKNTSGTINLKVVDNAGNEASASIGVGVSAAASEPYAVSLSPASPLSSGGQGLALIGDDKYHFDYALPFSFPFFGKSMQTVTVSTNGALYFSPPEIRDNGDADDVPNSVSKLNRQSMIAGMWDDLRTDRFSGDVFVTTPNASTIIFRWQGSTFASDTQPINFEIELRSDGTIKTRYGAGNGGLRPVVGISGGQADFYSGGPDDDYVVNSHTSTSTTLNLGNAQTVTFAPQTATTPTLPTLQLNQSSYTIAEGTGSLAFLVNRSGDLSLPVSVNYRTNDAAAFLQNCNVINGAATSRCDYVSLVGTLHFASGENSKTLFLPIVDDLYPEGSESFSILLSNPTGGAVLGANQSATITITDNGNDAFGQANPIDGTDFFVRQHYIDFLGREPDPASIGWNNQINNCVPVQPSCDRLSVSQGIYSSPEFKDRGYFIYKFYSVGLGRKPSYDEFVVDRARVSGFQSDAELEQSKLDFIADFTSRAEFTAIYNAEDNNTYVQHLYLTAGVTQVTVPNVGVFTVAGMQQRMATLGRTRGQVLREIAESPEVSARFNTESTIVMHYFGYLRRDPDAAYQDWINIFNQTGDSRNVTNGFVNSQEYRNRFAQ